MNEDGWESGLTADRIKKALAGFQADLQSGGFYRLSRPTDDMELILESCGINEDLRLPTTSGHHKLKYAFDRAGII